MKDCAPGAAVVVYTTLSPSTLHTPSGEIKLNIDNPDAVEVFEIGREYFVDFTLAEPS